MIFLRSSRPVSPRRFLEFFGINGKVYLRRGERKNVTSKLNFFFLLPVILVDVDGISVRQHERVGWRIISAALAVNKLACINLKSGVEMHQRPCILYPTVYPKLREYFLT